MRRTTLLAIGVLTVLTPSAVDAQPQAGYLTIRDGHLAWQQGGRARFWGVNLVDELGREKAESDQIARRVRQMGFDACRRVAGERACHTVLIRRGRPPPCRRWMRGGSALRR